MNDIPPPDVLRIGTLEDAASDIRHISNMVDVLFQAELMDRRNSTSGVLWVIRDMADLLAWKLERMHIDQRAAK